MRHRYGISLGVSPREPLSRTAELARAIDDRGFEALWYIDFQLGMKDVYAAMNLAALSTENVLIGAGVTNLVTRHPTVTANATAALDEFSNGRAVLGLGAGWSAVLGAGGTPSGLGALRSGIDEFRQLFSGEPCDLYGNQVRLATAKRQIPVYLAVSQPAMLRLAGETCDGAVLMDAADPEFCSWQLDYIHQGLETAGRDRGELTVDLFVTMSVGDDTESALDDVRAWATSQAATFHPWKQMPPAWEGFRGEFARAAGAYGLVDHLSLQGPCYGAAVDLAWACDTVVVSDEARLGLPSTSLGILYNPSSVARLHARLGSPTVRRLMVLQQELPGRELPPGTAIVVRSGTTVETAKRLLRILSADSSATAATKALLASLDSGEGFDPAVWQPEREARLASPVRRGALEARRAAIRKDQNECSPGAASAESARDRGHDAHGGAVVDGGAESVEEAHVVVADEHVDEPAELA